MQLAWRLSSCLTLALLGLSACSGEVRDPLLGERTIIERHGAEVVASGFLIAGEEGERLMRLLSEAGVQRLRIGHVPGGRAELLVRFITALRGKDVEVTGPCGSACALGSLAAKSVNLGEAKPGAVPPMLFFHGMFLREADGRMENAAAPSNLAADIVARRFPFLDRAVINEAMVSTDFKTGLMVTRNRHAEFEFHLCKPWPTDCRYIRSWNAGSL